MCTEPITAWRYKKIPLKAKDNEEMLKKYRKIYFHPLLDGEKIELPCGRCLECRLQKSKNWQTRITKEIEQWKYNVFITLTYSDENLPKIKGKPTLRKRDLQNFLKRLRKQETGIQTWTHPINGRIENPIRYFACGEYGDTKHRPHYHIILMNYCPNDLKFYKASKGSGEPLFTSKKIMELWGKGLCPIGTATIKSAGYIARYVQKKAYKEPNKILYDKNGNRLKKSPYEPEDEFIVMSRGAGIGMSYWLTNKEKIKKYGEIYAHGQTAPIPRYFKKLWEKEDQDGLDMWKYKKQKEIETVINAQKEVIESEEWKKDIIILKNKKERLEDVKNALKRNL